jgi:hypothetical protein
MGRWHSSQSGIPDGDCHLDPVGDLQFGQQSGDMRLDSLLAPADTPAV